MMTITYEQAYGVVQREMRQGWIRGTFCIDDRKIIETDDYYVFVVGAREFLIDRDRSFLAFGGRETVVYKRSGEIGRLAYYAVNTDPTFRERDNPNPKVLLPE